MKLAILALTANGARLGARLGKQLPGAELHVLAKFADRAPGCRPFSGDLGGLLSRLWAEVDGLVCIMASGIVVRSIAPLLEGKEKDPAVVVLDEAGQFAISLLSGHLGGANDLARRVAGLCGARPVITTASDVNGLLAWDEAARRAGLGLEPLAHVKHLNSLLLQGETIALVDRRGHIAPWYAATPGVTSVATFAAAGKAGAAGRVFVTHRLVPQLEQQPDLLVLRPRDLVVGIGCNRGTSAEEIEEAVCGELKRAFLSFASVALLASIEEKRDEAGLLAFATKFTLPLAFHPAAALNAVQAPSAPSPHALAAVGAVGVCEPAALLSASGGSLLVTKKKCGNVTVAVAEKI